MKSLADFETFYQKDLGGFLYELEERRRRVTGLTLKMWLTCGVILLVGLGVCFGIGIPLPFALIPVVPVLIIWYFVFIKSAAAAFTYEFKREIIRSIVKFIDEGLDYNPNGSVSMGDFMRSSIFRQTPDVYKGEDHVSGVVNGTRLEFSEVNAEYITRDSKGRTTHHTIFRGLFLVADFPKKFNGSTVVLPDVAQKMFGFLGQVMQKWNLLRGELVKLEDPEFEKEFVVYGDDQIEARYILTTSMMERLLAFRRKAIDTVKAGSNVYLSFTEGKVFVAVDCRRDLFEPSIFSSNDNFAMMRDYFETMSMAIGVVEDLKLNPRFKA